MIFLDVNDCEMNLPTSVSSSLNFGECFLLVDTRTNRWNDPENTYLISVLTCFDLPRRTLDRQVCDDRVLESEGCQYLCSVVFVVRVWEQ